ncbi:MAG: 23S rRNA (uracil-5-)-methyltransferase RumA [Elusimicrobia bacterium RIFOXYA2_FULL_40_6]|nr:MAG: 23S rRNA (uracil-5-)-methyltransferase RumA [Elusimicrobia bacterium RIFOXYA2_FULL_40_6]
MQCKHFGTCGGCSLQDIPYEEQLKTKQQQVQSVFKPLGSFEDLIRQIIPSPVQEFYRNKMEFVFAEENGRIVLGLHKKGKYDEVVDLQECLAFSPKTGLILEITRKWAAENKIPVYNMKKQAGTLRYLVLREAKSSSQLMVNLIVAITPYVFEYDFKKKASQLVKRLSDSGINAACVTAGLNDSKSDVALAEKNVLIHGSEFIEEKVGKINYKIFPYTFFQTNSYVCEKLYDTVNEFAQSHKDTTAFDLFCGSGGISLYISEVFEKIIGIELNSKAIENAAVNARHNNISNCEFVCERVENYLKKFETSQFKVKLSTVIIDPPRAGLAKKSIQSIIELNPANIIYVSCKLDSVINDLQSFLQYYKIVTVQPFDMFPHTPHLEIIVKLTHK